MNYLLLALSLAAFAFGALYLIAQFISIFGRAPFVPSESGRVEEMVRLAEIREGERAVDLGSGDGRVVIAAAKAGAYAVGWEMNPLLVLWSMLQARRFGVADRAKFRWGRYGGRDFKDMDIIFTYLLPSEMARVERWLPGAVRPGTRAVVNAFPFPNWQPERRSGNIYGYRIG